MLVKAPSPEVSALVEALKLPPTTLEFSLTAKVDCPVLVNCTYYVDSPTMVNLTEAIRTMKNARFVLHSVYELHTGDGDGTPSLRP